MEKSIYSRSEVAAKIGVTARTIRNWEKSGKLVPVGYGTGKKGYSLCDILKVYPSFLGTDASLDLNIKQREAIYVISESSEEYEKAVKNRDTMLPIEFSLTLKMDKTDEVIGESVKKYCHDNDVYISKVIIANEKLKGTFEYDILLGFGVNVVNATADLILVKDIKDIEFMGASFKFLCSCKGVEIVVID